MEALSRRALVMQMSCAAVMCRAEQDPPWRARVTNAGEKGERLIIRGRVLRSPGGSPAPGTAIMVYQTDSTGIYSTKSGRPIDVARLRGQFKAGPQGQYEIVTIRPGSYPGGGAPAHIHVNLLENGKEPREIFEFFFSGDKLLRGGEKGYVLEPRRGGEGTLIAVQDVALNQ